MKPSPVKAIQKEDFKDAPEWFLEKFIPLFNNMAENNFALFTRLTIEENTISYNTTLNMTSGQEVILEHSLKGRPKRVLVDYLENNAKIKGLAWRIVSSSQVGVIVDFEPSGSTKVTLTVMG